MRPTFSGKNLTAFIFYLALALRLDPGYSQHFESTSQLPEPPYHGTIFIDPDIVTEADSSSFISATYTGRGERVMYDRRVNDWVTINAHLFNAVFTDGSAVEVQVNPEFGSDTQAQVQVDKYLPSIGQIPTGMRGLLETVWIHRGREPFGGGNNNILIHTEMGDEYIRDGILEETMLHEAAHTSLDPLYRNAEGWRTAQQNDPTYISTYARDYPDREDIAETIVPYIAVQFREDRISNSTRELIALTIPNRIAFLNSLNLDMYPIVIGTSTNTEAKSETTPKAIQLGQNYPNPFNPGTIIPFNLAESGEVSLRIYNSMGIEVATLVNETRVSGRHEISWDASGLASGIYFYRLATSAGVQTRKMLLLK